MVICFLSLIGILFVSGIVAIFWLIYFDGTTQCPKCKKFWAKKNVDEKWMGQFEKGAYIGNRNRRWRVIPHEKYKVYHQCKYCNHEWMTTMVKALWE